MKARKLRFLIMLIAVTAAAISLASCNKKTPEEIAKEFSFNATVIKCNAGKTLTDSDLQEVETIVKGKVGDKFKSAEKAEGFAPTLDLEKRGYDEETLTNMSEEELNKLIADTIGDRLIVTCLTLTEEEYADVYTAIAFHFEFDHENGKDLNYPEVDQLFKQDYK